MTSDKARRGIAPTNLVKIKGLTGLFGADGWHEIWGERYPNWGNYTAKGKLKTSTAMNAAIRRTKFLRDRVEIVVARGQEWLPSLEDSFLDWV